MAGALRVVGADVYSKPREDLMRTNWAAWMGLDIYARAVK